MSDSIAITLSEQEIHVPAGMLLHDLRDEHKPGADVVILNGAPVAENPPLQDGDAVVFIRRGEVPPKQELEALMASRHTPGLHQRIKQATVGIAGAGGLGSAVAVALARIGVGTLIIADFDVVEPSNLNRQQFFVDQIGLPKVDAMCMNLQRINPYVDIRPHQIRLTPDNIPKIFNEVDVMVEAFDRADQKAMLAECFGRHFPETPIVLATGLAGHGASNTILTQKMGRSMVVVGDLVTTAQPGTGLMAPRVGVAAHHQANAVLRLILGEDPVG